MPPLRMLHAFPKRVYGLLQNRTCAYVVSCDAVDANELTQADAADATNKTVKFHHRR